MSRDAEGEDRRPGSLTWEDAEKDLRQLIVDLVGGDAWQIEIYEKEPGPDWPAGAPGIGMGVRGPEDVMRKLHEVYLEWIRAGADEGQVGGAGAS